MALIGWWKLAGDLKDSVGGMDGTDAGGTPLTWTGTTKFGGSATQINSTKRINLPLFSRYPVLKEISISCWVINVMSGYQQLLMASPDSPRTLNIHYYWNGTMYWDVGNSQGSYNRLSFTNPAPNNGRWHHWVFTAGPAGLRVYLNGAEVASNPALTDIMVSNSTSDFIALGNVPANSNPFNGVIQDFRIYDHQLSQKEVKDLSKGKFFHLKFDQAFEPTINMMPQSSGNVIAGSGWSWENQSAGIMRYTYNGEIWAYYGSDISVVSGRTYTVSCEVYVSTSWNGGGSILTFALEQALSASFGYNTSRKGTWQKISYTGVAGSSNLRVLRYTANSVSYASAGYVLWRNIQVEEKDHFTDFTPSSRTLLEDSSGWNSEPTVSPSVRFNASSVVGQIGPKHGVFNGVDGLVTTGIPQSWLRKEFCFSVWVNPSVFSNYKGVAGDHGGTNQGIGFLQWETDGFYCLWGDGSTWRGTTKFTLPANTWSHVVWDLWGESGGYHKVWVNGVLIQNEAVTSTFSPWQNLLIGRSYSASDRYWQGGVDDFRIYLSHPTQADVDELYRSRGWISNVGSLGTPFLKETGRTYKPSKLVNQDYGNWVLNSTGSQPGFSVLNQPDKIVPYLNPQGVEDLVWYGISQGGGASNNGWSPGSYSPIDRTKKYRFSVWIRRENLVDASMLFGLYTQNGSSHAELLTGAGDNNPYFFVNTFEVGKWLLLVGFVHPVGTTSGAEGGVYDTQGNLYQGSGTNYRWAPGTTTAGMRCYLYYSSNPDSHVMWYRPRMDLCDGTEPNIADLISCRENPTLYNNPTLSTGPSKDGTYYAGEINEVGPVDGLVAWYPFDTSVPSGGEVTDISGNGNHGTASGGGLTVGVGGPTGRYITGGYIVHHNWKRGEAWSRSFWFYPTTGSGGARFVFGTNSAWPNINGDAMWGSDDGTSWDYLVSDGVTYFGSNLGVTFAVNTWYHIITIFKGKSLGFEVYVNNVLTATNSGTLANNPTGQNSRWLYQSGYPGFTGPIAEARIFNRALTPDERSALFSVRPKQLSIDSKKTLLTSQYTET